MNHLGEALLDDATPPVEVLFVYNCNPLATMPDQTRVRAGLAREDLFTVVFDQVLTDTARYADVVLPATTFLEHRELSRGYGAFALHLAEPVVDPVGEARPNYEVFAELAGRLGVGECRGRDRHACSGSAPACPRPLRRAAMHTTPRRRRPGRTAGPDRGRPGRKRGPAHPPVPEALARAGPALQLRGRPGRRPSTRLRA